MADGSAPMTLRLLTPAGLLAEAGCDSAVLTLADGGLVGVMRGHAPAVMALGKGAVRASLEGRPVLRAETEGGFASVKDNAVTVVADSVSITE